MSSPQNPENVPWAAASFLDPIPTELTFTNEDTVTRKLDLNLLRYRENLDQLVPDSLAPRESATVTVDIHRPRYFFLRSGEHMSHRPLLPGRPRHLSLVAGDLVAERGPFSVEYDYLDAVFVPLNPPGRAPIKPEDLQTYATEALHAAYQHRDSVPLPKGLPDYLVPMLDRSLRVGVYAQTLGLRGYLQFFYADTLAVPPALLDSVRTTLREPGCYQSLHYADLFNRTAMLEGESTTNPDYPIATNNRIAFVRAFQAGYPAPERANDAIATRLVTEITDPRVFLQKMELIDTLKALLPANYRQAVAQVEKTTREKATDPAGMVDFLTTNWLTPDGTEAAPGQRSERPLRLLKFWFAGCYPCLVQLPHERTLLSNHPEVELIYVAHNTKKAAWLTYLEEHAPPAEQQFLVSDTKAVLAAAGTTGAPTYVLLDADGAIVCRPCPKPDDPLLAQTITKELAR
ncbi:MAG: hypothetical protein AAFZ52_15535 [Bacteroidota bacterium]